MVAKFFWQSLPRAFESLESSIATGDVRESLSRTGKPQPEYGLSRIHSV